ncbi:hypothetical protein CAPTEDRAFT_192482 [Capitella teleta]|uniref:C2H2-type domain-containing protein n=1 Tax=Capitella teleta TaxID=283909 RepID=R7U9A2_CAPTE|nr:hypothetical protein CAPTEDRAFT_192482 [Capitella teleta]|eukprot:ELU00388.1 hypothetical protein CAPTEDRAFT_192482 [Capitella teleta]
MPLETYSERFDKRNVQEARRMTAVGQGHLSLTAAAMEEFADCLGLFECSYCLQLFGSGDNLAAHRRDVHGFTDESKTLSTQPQPTTVKTEILVKAEIHDRPPSCAGLKTEKVKKQDNVTSRNGAVLGELKIKNQRESGECAFIEEYISNDKVSPKKEPGLEEPPYRHYDTKNGILEAGNYSLNNGGEDDIIKSDLLGRRRHCSLGDLVQPEGVVWRKGGILPADLLFTGSFCMKMSMPESVLSAVLLDTGGSSTNS